MVYHKLFVILCIVYHILGWYQFTLWPPLSLCGVNYICCDCARRLFVIVIASTHFIPFPQSLWKLCAPKFGYPSNWEIKLVLEMTFENGSHAWEPFVGDLSHARAMKNGYGAVGAVKMRDWTSYSQLRWKHNVQHDTVGYRSLVKYRLTLSDVGWDKSYHWIRDLVYYNWQWLFRNDSHTAGLATAEMEESTLWQPLRVPQNSFLVTKQYHPVLTSLNQYYTHPSHVESGWSSWFSDLWKQNRMMFINHSQFYIEDERTGHHY